MNRRTLTATLLPMGLASLAYGEAFERRDYPMPERCDRALAIDVDGDGDLDLVGICRTRVVAVILPEGESRILARALSGGMIHGAVWDADGDGDQDIAVCRFQQGDDSTIAWLENPSWKVHVVDREVNGTHGVAVGDLNGDGREDLVAANVMGFRPLSVSWYDGVAKERAFVDEAKAGGRPHYLDTADVNGDGHVDVLLGKGDGFSLYLGPSWDRQVIAEKKGGTNVCFTDINGDGKLDIVGSCGHGTGIFWYENASWEEREIESTVTDIHALDAGDLDGDGDIDLAAGAFGGYGPDKNEKKKLFWYENDGSGQFSRHDLDVDHQQESYALEIVDADGWNDILIGGRGSENLVWYRNQKVSEPSR